MLQFYHKSMQEIRFNQPAPLPTEGQDEKSKVDNVVKKGNKKNKFIQFLFLLVKIIVILFLLYGGLIAYRYFLSNNNAEKERYVSVFLTNNQVYFGKMVDNRNGEISLKEVYYLQDGNTDFSATGAPLQGSSFMLVKLGQELHGPTDEMYINKEQVLFYEYLRDDSQVVKTIENYKNK